MKSAVSDPSLIIAAVFLLALAILTLALLIIKHMVRKKDIMRGSYVDNDENR